MYIYIISHPQYDGWIKLGRAINPINRLIGYQTCCPYRQFSLRYYKKIGLVNVGKIEKYFNQNVNGNGYEWFNCPVEYAIDIIEKQLLLITQDSEYLSKQNKKIYVGSDKRIKYDYFTDGKIFTSLDDLKQYTKIKNIRSLGQNFKPGKVVISDGYEIIRQKHHFKCDKIG